MGNWRTVNIIGTCAANEVAALREALEPGEDYLNFHCLCITKGLGGLGNWARTDISARGNLAERNYDQESVKEELEKLVKVAPSLSVKVHCGGEYESLDCVATVVAENGKVEILPPQVEKVMGKSEDEIKAALYRAMGGRF